MRILDSNILIYAAIDEHANLREIIRNESPVASAISKLEVLGYHKHGKEDYEIFQEIFRGIEVIEISGNVIGQAIEFKRLKSMSLGDAIIAATAFLHGFTLVSRNTKDLSHIVGLECSNPFQT